MHDSGYDKPLLNSVILQSKDDGGYISCGGVYSNDVNDYIDYGFNLQCQRFHKDRWSFDENMTMNEMRNSSGFSYHNSRFVKYIKGHSITTWTRRGGKGSAESPHLVT